MDKKGSVVTAQNDDGVLVTRNSSFFKSVPAAAEESSTTEISKDPADVRSGPDTLEPQAGGEYVTKKLPRCRIFETLHAACVNASS